MIILKRFRFRWTSQMRREGWEEGSELTCWIIIIEKRRERRSYICSHLSAHLPGLAGLVIFPRSLGLTNSNY